ncbi:MAG: LamG-like jellyroll fold domain-containing protein, partial [Methylococcaceae bacterium]
MLKIKVLGMVGVVAFSGMANAGLQDGLVAYWSQDHCDVSDTSGHKLDGVIRGTPVCTTGKVGKAFQFNGVDDYLLIDKGNIFSDFEKSQQFTLSAWINIQRLANDGWIYNPERYFPVVQKYDDSSNWGWAIEFYNNTSVVTVLFVAGVNTAIDCPTITPTINKWQHLSVIINNLSVKIFLDGKNVSTCNLLSPLFVPTSGKIYVAYSPLGGPEYAKG